MNNIYYCSNSHNNNVLILMIIIIRPATIVTALLSMTITIITIKDSIKLYTLTSVHPFVLKNIYECKRS